MEANIEATAKPAAALRSKLGYITEQELRELLGVTLATLRNRQATGTLPVAYKLGKEKLYKLSEVETWIRRRRVSRA